MNTLDIELERLYFLPDQHCYSLKPCMDDGAHDSGKVVLPPQALVQNLTDKDRVAIDLVDEAGMVRTLVISFENGTDWNKVTSLYQGVLEELGLPAPALVVSGVSGYQVWFSLSDPVQVDQAKQFLNGLCRQYLAESTLSRIRCYPAPETVDAGPCLVDLAPAFQNSTQRWSAFIDPGMGGMFSAESGLDMAPNMGGQAAILSGFESIKAEDFQCALASLQPSDGPEKNSDENLMGEQVGASERDTSRDIGGHYNDPKSFLMAVMNDPSCCLADRIEAAKALLPHFKDDPKQ